MSDAWKLSELSRRSLASVARDLAELGLETGTSGNLSVLAGELVIITGSGQSFSDASDPENLAVVRRWDGMHVGGPVPSSDLACHLEVYSSRSDAGAIVHTHSHFVTLASVLGESIPVMSTMQADYFGAEIAFVPYANHRTGVYGDAGKFDSGSAFLLEKHGGLMVLDRSDLDRSAQRLMALEEVSRLYFETRLVKSRFELEPIPRDDVELLYSYFSHGYGQR